MPSGAVGRVHGVPDHAEPTQTPSPGNEAAAPRASRRPVKAVLFDFHGTLAQVEEPRQWVLEAAAACGVTLDRVRATSLADRLLTAGRAGGPLPARVPPRLAELWADRDLYQHAHRGAYTGLAETVDAGIDGFRRRALRAAADRRGLAAVRRTPRPR